MSEFPSNLISRINKPSIASANTDPSKQNVLVITNWIWKTE